jgi:CDP-glycerol glycerophosphotransferase
MNVVYRKIVKLLQIIISVFIKQNNDLILIASCHGNRFADNSKYFFKHLVKYEYKNFYLLTKDKNLYISLNKEYPGKVLYSYSFKALILFCEAKFMFYSFSSSDWYPFQLSKNSTNVCLWHGAPLKKFGYPIIKQKNNFFLRKFYNEIKKINYLIVSSDAEKEKFKLCYPIGEEKILVTGTPRNEFLVTSKNTPKAKYLKGYTILYAPTFRRSNKAVNVLPFNDLDLIQLNKFLEEKNAYLLIRKHHYEYYQKIEHMEKKWFNYNRIIDAGISKHADVQELLLHTDCLVTDYSGIYIDFLLSKKPILFIPYDQEEYESKEGFLYNYNEVTPGKKVFSQEEFLKSIDSIFKKNKENSNELNRVKKLFHKYDTGMSERILKLIGYNS